MNTNNDLIISAQVDLTEISKVAFPSGNKPAVLTTVNGVQTLGDELKGVDLTPIAPVQLFDDFYFVGTMFVGSFVINTHNGIIMIDAGFSDIDGEQFAQDIKKLNINPSDIKLILITHEHVDHYGGAQYLKSHICPQAKIAMSLIGWNNLQTRPAEFAYGHPRPKLIDIHLVDGQTITLGNIHIKVVFTPGHSPGCLSLIIPIEDNGQSHVVGIMGGNGVPFAWNEAFLYYSSIDYFRIFTGRAGCDIGLTSHTRSLKDNLPILHTLKPGDPNPLIIGTEKFETVYLQKFKDNFFSMANKLPPDKLPSG